MKRRVILAVVAMLAVAVAGVTLAQGPSGPPKPGPEHQKLAFFVGKWNTGGESKPSAFGPGGKYTANETCEWFNGGFAVVCHSSGKFGEQAIKGLTVTSYDPAEKTYVFFETNSVGENVFARGTLDGDTWTWNNQGTSDGKPWKARFTLKQASADSATYKFEMAGGDDPLTLVMEGKQTRQK